MERLPFNDQERFTAYRFVLDLWRGFRTSDSPASESERIERSLIKVIAGDDNLWALERKKTRLEAWLKRAGLPSNRQSLIDRQQ